MVGGIKNSNTRSIFQNLLKLVQFHTSPNFFHPPNSSSSYFHPSSNSHFHPKNNFHLQSSHFPDLSFKIGNPSLKRCYRTPYRSNPCLSFKIVDFFKKIENPKFKNFPLCRTFSLLNNDFNDNDNSARKSEKIDPMIRVGLSCASR